MKQFCAFLAGIVVALGGAYSARAADPPPPPPDNSGISQYVEQVPSSGGAKAPGITKAKKTKLPRRVANKLKREAGTDAPLLNEVATSSALGAPTAKHARRKPHSKTGESPKTGRDSRNVLAASVVSPSGGASNAPLFIAAGIALAATAAFAGWRFRGLRRRPPQADL